MSDFIEKVIKSISPEACDLLIMEVHDFIDSVKVKDPAIENLILLNIVDTQSLPVLVYGFEQYADLRKNQDSEMLEIVRYLQLPATLEELSKIFEGRRISKNRLRSAYRAFSVRQVRAFKHRFDNHWQVLNIHANHAKREAHKSPSQKPVSLLEFSSKMLQERFDEYKDIEVYVDCLDIPNRKQAPATFGRLRDMLALISGMDTPLAISTAFSFVEGFKTISEILSKAKESDVVK